MTASQGADTASHYDVEAFIDRRPIGWRELSLLVICTLTLFIDGLDTYLVGKIAPAIASAMGQPPSAMTTAFTAQQIGMALGAFIMPPMADRYGRKIMLAVCGAGFGVLSLLTALADDLTMFAVLRGLSGLFFGAMLPIGLALLAEMTPRRLRAQFISIALVGFAGGNVGAGAVAAWLLDAYGWQFGFILGGILPLAALPLLLIVHESLPYRVSRNPADPRIGASIARMEPGIALPDQPVWYLGSKIQGEQGGPALLFTRRYRAKTLLLWAAMLLSLGNITLLASWMATFFQEMAGVPIQQFAKYAMLAFIGGATGTLAMGWMMDRMRATLVIPAIFLIDALALIGLGLVPFGTLSFLAVLTVWNLAQTGGQAGLNAMATISYPPSMRGTGFGWASGWGRIGGIIAPSLGGAALDWNLSLQSTMFLVSLSAVGVAILVGLIGVFSPDERAKG